MTLLTAMTTAQRIQLDTAVGSLYNPKGLRRFKAALDASLFQPVHISVFGDSLADGVGTTGSATQNTDNVLADQRGYPGQLRTKLAAILGAPEGGLITPRNGSTVDPDARVVRNGGASASTTGPIWTGWSISAVNNGGSAATITYSLPSCTAFDILLYRSNSGNFNGGLTYSVDGGGAVSVPAGNDGFVAIPVSGLSNSAHTVVLTGTGTGSAVIANFGLRYHSGKGVSVGRFTRAGWTLLDSFGLGSNNNAFGNSGALDRLAAGYGAFSPALTVIAFLHNDWANQLVANPSGIFSTPENYEIYLRDAVSRCVATGGSVLLLAPQEPPSQTVPGGRPLSDYRAVMKAIALDTDHVSFLDENEYFGSVSEALNQGIYYNSTTVHKSVKGYGGVASLLLQSLTRSNIVAPI